MENIQNNKMFMELPYNGVGIVTNNFHVFRETQIAKVNIEFKLPPGSRCEKHLFVHR